MLDKITNKTSNSFLVTQSKNSDKGINCDQWFDDKTFNKRFSILIIREINK